MTEQEMQAIQQMLEASEKRMGMMMDAKLDAMERRLENTLAVEMQTVNEKLDTLTFQMDTVYKWVDGIDLEVKQLKRAP